VGFLCNRNLLSNSKTTFILRMCISNSEIYANVDWILKQILKQSLPSASLRTFILESKRSLIITDFVRIGIDISNTCLGCIKKSGETIKIGEEYSEGNCSRLCVCTSDGIQCRTMCPIKTFNLLDCKLPYTLKFIVIPAGPERLACFCTRVDCVLPGIGQHLTFASPSPVTIQETKDTF
jgi:hypothetical protein